MKRLLTSACLGALAVAALMPARFASAQAVPAEPAETSVPADSAERNELRCRELGDMAACDEILKAKPNDGEIVIAKADALAKANRPAEALALYRRGAALASDVPGLAEKMKAAESQRQKMASKCQTETDVDAALEACDVALLRGASDELAIEKRRGSLLQRMDEPSQALDAYIAASQIVRDDPEVSQAIVALTERAGRKDAVALAARGNALLTLNRPAEAIKAFREAQALSPGLPEIEAPLAAAEELARSEARLRLAIADEERTEGAPSTSTPSAATAAAPRQQAETPAEPADSARGSKEEPRRYSNASPASRSH